MSLRVRVSRSTLDIRFPGVSAGIRVPQGTLGTSLSLGIPGIREVIGL